MYIPPKPAPGKLIPSAQKSTLIMHLAHLVNDGGISAPLAIYLRKEIMLFLEQLDDIIQNDEKSKEKANPKSSK